MRGEDNGQEMLPEEKGYPVYRRTHDGRHFFRIEALDRFTEIQIVGNRHLIHGVTARAYPELVRIMEMVELRDGRYEPMEPSEWEEQWSRTEQPGNS